ncbi:hypothetical protein MKX03_002146 [Papaver bracteatum]|nr:hypothetical protein MKX03_002146 [Papaver bracteatum]
MDPGKPIDDQFSKLHPCLPVNTRIAIICAGPSYNNVIMFDKHRTVGGMCESVDIKAKETESELEELDSHKFALIEGCTRKYKDLKVADDYVSVISLTLKLQDEVKNSNRIGVHAMSEIASSSTPEFLKLNGFNSVPNSVAYGYTASGYGFVQDMPYAYIYEFTRTSMAGKIRRFKGGYTSVWQKISQSLPINFRCNTEVSSIKRRSVGVSIDVINMEWKSEGFEFDKVIISGSLPFNNGRTYRSPLLTSPDVESKVMEMNDLEKELFSKVQTIDYYTTALKIKGFEHIAMGFYYLEEFMDDPATIGNLAMQRFYADTNIFLFWSYGNSENIGGSKVTEFAVDIVKSMGGLVEEFILQRRFKYFPHVNSQDMKDGFYDKLESELQGMQNTYYVGGLMVFELTERNSSYAMALVCKHFANDNSLPMYPYVKVNKLKAKLLFPLVKHNKVCSRKELDELPGVEFPDLSSLDAYLKHCALINEEGKVVCQRTYAELHANASHIAHKLLTSVKPVIKPGDLVLLVHVPGLEFVDAFFGCLRARVIPVPVLPPDPMQIGGQALVKIENISESCNAVAILTTLGYHSAVRAGAVKNIISLTKKNGKCSARWPDLPWLHTDSWVKKSSQILPELKSGQSTLQPDELCFLQFTSGSTGDAKGVMITHGGLIHNVKLMRRRYKSTSKTVLVSWLPQYHDMGLIGGLFTALVSGGTAILFSPLTFIKNPLLWLQTMSKYSATHSARPNFAFELMVRRLESDKEKSYDYNLSSMVFLMVAAEPVRQKTLKRFIELTHSYNLSQEVLAPGYGLAENCVFVSCAFGDGNLLDVYIQLDWQGRVCCGYVHPNDPDVDIRIVDPETGIEHEYGKEGEIWISSPSMGIGYWGKKEQSMQTFQNVPTKKYLRTGDLGRVLDSKLFITGRIKDLIIVAGRIIYSADIEKTVESIPVQDTSDQVGLVVIAEVRDGKSIDMAIIQKIQTRVAEEHGVAVASVKLIKPRTISKTTSGKIRRFECLKQFKDGTLNLVTEPISVRRTLMRSFTTGSCREGKTPRPQLSSTPISQNAKKSATEVLVSYGIDSIGVVRAAQKLSDFLGVPVGAVDIFTATCIDDLTRFSENLLHKSQQQSMSAAASHHPEIEMHSDKPEIEVSGFRKMGIWLLQFLEIVYASTMLVLPEYVSVSACLSLLSSTLKLSGQTSLWSYLMPLDLAPVAWILCVDEFYYKLHPKDRNISIWSLDFFKWWTLYKVQQVAGRVLGVHLRGTIFLKFWFEMLGANIGSSVLLDTIDITDPSLVSIGDGTVITEGVLIQSHEVKNGTLSFLPVRIGRKSSIDPYAVIQKGSILAEDSDIIPLQKTDGATLIHTDKASKMSKDKTSKELEFLYHLAGIYMVGFISSLSAAILYYFHLKVSQNPASLQHFTFLCIGGAFYWFPFTLIAYAAMFATIPSNPAKFALSIGMIYIVHGLILSFLTSILTRFLDGKPDFQRNQLKICCIYLRLLGAKVGKNCSIKEINPVSDPELISIGNGVHLGDFSRIIAGFYTSNAKFWSKKVQIQDNAVVGSQSLILPGSVIEKYVILGAISVGNPLTYKLPIKPHLTSVALGSQHNSLSADDDARIDARGAAIRILKDDGNNDSSPLLDLTLKTGKAFYARTIADFAMWLVGGLPAREEHVKRSPHIRNAVWDSLRNADSCSELHYYSNIYRIIRCKSGQEMYVKFKIRPVDEIIGEESGKVEPIGILPPETGAIPRDLNDTRPLLFLADDFQRRVNSPDCTRPWDQDKFPFIDIGKIVIDKNLNAEESQRLEFNPFLGCHEVDVIRATSCSQSASIDHGRSLIYEICQHLRNGTPLPQSWKYFLQQSDVKVDLSGCPMASAVSSKNQETQEQKTVVVLKKTWYQSLWSIFGQPLLQTLFPYFILGLVVFQPLNWVLWMKENKKLQLHILLPIFWVSTGILAGLVCALFKWVLVGRKWETIYIWSRETFMDTTWQALRTLVGDYFMEMTGGSIFFNIWMKQMGSKLDFGQGVYVDSMGALLNPEMVEIEKGGSIGRDALLFGHIYEGEDGEVKFGKIKVCEGGFVGSRAIFMPGVRVENHGTLGASSLAMKEEMVR